MSDLNDNELTALSVFDNQPKADFVKAVAEAAEITERSAKGVVTRLVTKEVMTDEDDELALTEKGSELKDELSNITLDEDDSDLLVEDDDDEEPEPVTMVKQAAKKAKKKADAKPATKRKVGAGRFDHSACGHPLSGAEGKKARAACRREHQKAAEKAEAK
jgi:hypothetical protein